MMKRKIVVFLIFGFSLSVANAQKEDSLTIRKFYDFALTESSCYENLRVLCKEVGNRISGSQNAQKAVEWGKKTMEGLGFDKVYLQEVMVPKWVRGEESLAFSVESTKRKGKETSGKLMDAKVTALGGSVGTDGELNAVLVEVNSFEEMKTLGEKDKLKGKIVFLNRPMDRKSIVTFRAYGGCVDQRAIGASEAARYGAVGVIIRSVTQADDDHPHTGSLHYNDSLPKIPAAAISTQMADKISEEMKKGNDVRAFLKLGCKTLKDEKSYNVIGELTGTVDPKKIIVVGGHLDSWDIGEGAHDDGAGCVHSIEVLNILKKSGYKPRYTIRVVLFMNEENGVMGGKKYAEEAKADGTTHLAAIESDRGGFTPIGFSVDGTDDQYAKVMTWKKLMEPYQLVQFERGYSGVDIGKLKNGKTLLMGLVPDSQRYFDFHHAETDVFEGVHKRELELGAAAMATMVYLIDTYDLP